MPPRSDARILVADDTPVNQRVILRQLQRLGYRADVVANGVEAVVALDGTRYDLVLMDCQMPEVNGFEATREIRSREEGGRRTPIIALTADATEAARQACLSAGMDGYLTKPVRERDLAEALERWLPPASVEDDPIDSAAADRLRSLSGGSDSFLRELAVLFLDDAPPRISVIRTAIAGGHPEHAAAEAHALKSSSGNIGGNKLNALAAELEAAANARDLERLRSTFAGFETEYARMEKRLRAIISSA